MTDKIRIFFLAIIIFFFLYLGRLFQLQVLGGRELLVLAENNRVHRQKIAAPRGLILDRTGRVLADNRPVYLLLEGEEKGQEEEGEGRGRDEGQGEGEEGQEAKVLSREEALALQAANRDGQLKIELKRNYPAGSVLAHLLGYLGQVSLAELGEERLDLKGYRSDSLIGQAGIEAQYEEMLRGREGSELVEVNTQGEVVRRMGRILPSPGKALSLAIDERLQKKAAEAFGEIAGQEAKGAVVATNPQNGEVLVLYSAPSFDPNLFLNPEGQGQLMELITDEENQPFINRAIAGLYPPGSTFKMVTAIAGLEEGEITPQTKFIDTGVVRYGAFTYTNWYYTSHGKTEGEINVARALARSTDTFFYKLGEWVGIQKLNQWGEKFGVNQKTGLDLPSERAGFMATPEWKEKERGEKWFLGNTYHLAIGQGDLALTPIGVNQITSAIANEGKICTPRMLKLGAENTPYEPDCRDLGIKKEYLETVKEGMIGACSPGGTAGSFAALPFKTACKTGTAEIGDDKHTHAWFTAFAPIDDPQISVTVLVERGGEGSSISAPIAKEILREWFKVAPELF